METPMSTPTPRTDRILGGIIMSAGSRRDVELMEIELAAALARIAELENLERRICKWVQARSITEDAPAGDLIQRMNDHDKRRLLRLDHYEREIDSLTRQLSESQAQLASAREDGARLDYLFKKSSRMPMSDGRGGWLVAEYIGHVIGRGDTPRSAIDSARGVTSQPTPAETAPESTWQPIETAPKDGTVILASSPNWRRATEMKWDSEIETFYFMNGTHPMFDPPTVWQPLPPPPQGKETGEKDACPNCGSKNYSTGPGAILDGAERRSCEDCGTRWEFRRPSVKGQE